MKGFTAIEILIVISITLILVVASIPIYGNLQVSAQLNETNTQITQALRIARGNSLHRFNSTNHGVKFESDRYTLYQGGSYATRDIDYDRETILDGALVISTDLGGDEVNFSKSFGVSNTTGIITLTHAVDGVRHISINSLGISEEEQ